jgi:hypothetical protein
VNLRTILIALTLVSTAFGQRHKFSWQEACFNNLSAPYCPGHDFALHKVKPGKDGKPQSGLISERLQSATDDASPSVIVMGGVNWRFADPQADALASIGFSKLSVTPLARSILSAAGAKEGLAETDLRKIYEALSGVDEVALSLKGDQLLVMVAGAPSEAAIPALDTGWTAAAVPNGILFGPAEAVAQAVQRISDDGPLNELARFAERRQANGEFWAAWAPSAAGPEAANSGVKQYALKATMRERLTTDAAFEFKQAPDPKAIQSLPIAAGGAVIQGNIVHGKTSMEADEVAENVTAIASTPLGQYLGILVKAARYIPVRQARVRPVITGMDPDPSKKP